MDLTSVAIFCAVISAIVCGFADNFMKIFVAPGSTEIIVKVQEKDAGKERKIRLHFLYVLTVKVGSVTLEISKNNQSGGGR